MQRLVLSHYSPSWTAPEYEVIARVRQAGYASELWIAHDGDSLDFDPRPALKQRASKRSSHAKIGSLVE